MKRILSVLLLAFGIAGASVLVQFEPFFPESLFLSTGLDKYGYDIAVEAGVGYSGGKVFRYKAEN